jgi:hypothetical protein
MAGPIAALERFFERLFERPAARLFSPRIEIAHLQREIERAMEAGRQTARRRTFAPHRYRLVLHPADLLGFEGRRERVVEDLARSVHELARQRGYLLGGRPHIELETATSVTAGDVVVHADPPTDDPRTADGRRPPLPVPARPDEPDGAALEGGTSVFAAARPALPAAVLVVRRPDGSTERITLTAGSLRIGRAPGNDLVLEDDRVSRSHGRLAVRHGLLVYTDLESTNGSFLNGRRVSEIALGPGDVLQLGRSALTIEPAA